MFNMRIPSNVLNFAAGEKNMAPYIMFRDYWNHYRSNGGAKNVEFSKVDDKGNPISFEEKEALMNAAFKREIARVAGVNFADFPLEAYATNPQVNWATFAIVSAMVDMILPESIIETTGLYTDVRVIPWGDSASFEIKPRDLFVVSKAGHAKRTSEVKKQFNGQVNILPEMRELSTQVSLYKVLAGTESLADFTAKVVRSMETQLTVDAYNAFATAMAALPSTTTTGLQVSGYSQASLVRLCQQVGAWNQGAKPIVVGTQLALVSVLPDDANYRYTLNDEFVSLGYIKTAFGYDVMCLPQVADITTPFGTVISNSYLWIVSPSSQKILKLVLEGSTLSNTTAPFQNANLTQSTTIYKSWGLGVATNAVAGIITL
jgi:hypothetical protein